jgi:hypothetical protein
MESMFAVVDRGLSLFEGQTQMEEFCKVAIVDCVELCTVQVRK